MSPKPEYSARSDVAASQVHDPGHLATEQASALAADEGGPPIVERPGTTRRRERSDAPSSFEAAFAELQRVVEQLEDGGLDLERGMALFERGTQLAQVCERYVDEAELRVTRLSAESASPLSEAPVET